MCVIQCVFLDDEYIFKTKKTTIAPITRVDIYIYTYFLMNDNFISYIHVFKIFSFLNRYGTNIFAENIVFTIESYRAVSLVFTGNV